MVLFKVKVYWLKVIYRYDSSFDTSDMDAQVRSVVVAEQDIVVADR